MGHPPPRPGQDGLPSRLGLDGVPQEKSGLGTPPPGTGYAWTGYAVGGTPLAVSRMRTVLFKFKNTAGEKAVLHWPELFLCK